MLAKKKIIFFFLNCIYILRNITTNICSCSENHIFFFLIKYARTSHTLETNFLKIFPCTSSIYFLHSIICRLFVNLLIELNFSSLKYSSLFVQERQPHPSLSKQTKGGVSNEAKIHYQDSIFQLVYPLDHITVCIQYGQ